MIIQFMKRVALIKAEQKNMNEIEITKIPDLVESYNHELSMIESLA